MAARTLEDRIKSIRTLARVLADNNPLRSSASVVIMATIRELDSLGKAAFAKTISALETDEIKLSALQDEHEANVLHHFAKDLKSHDDGAGKRFAERLPVLVRAGVDVNAANRWGVTPLHLAVASPSPLPALALLGQGAKVDPLNNAGNTPLFYASSASIPVLIKAGAAIDHDSYGMTPLQLQLENENLEGARLSLAAGASPAGASAALRRHEEGLVVLSEAALEFIRVATHDAALSAAVMDAPSTPKVRI